MPAKYLRLKQDKNIEEDLCPECGVPSALWSTVGYRLFAVLYCGPACAQAYLARDQFATKRKKARPMIS